MSQARAADVEKMKLQMMQAMNIKDPKELQRMAREYCKDMAVELTLPAYHRLATQISRSITKNREVFDALSSTEKVVQLMKAVMEDMEIVEGFKMALDQEDKDATICPELSSDKRAAGNSAFQKKKDEQALNLYSEAAMASLVTTEEGKKDAALALANRSAVWIKMKKYSECLDDLEAAQLFGYPTNILYKVVDRQAKCLAALGRIDEARTSYNRVILLLKQSNLDADKQEAWKKEVDAELQKLKTAKVPEESKKEETSLLTSPNPRIPQFSDAVELVFSPLVGRHGVATRDIEVGEVLMLDTATTVHLLCGTRLTNCTNCAARVNPITGKPSPVTPTARFCCSACLKTGMESYHPVEAKTNVQKLFWSKKEERFEETSGNILLTLRSVTQKPLQYFLDNKDFTKVDETFGVEFSSPEDKVCFSDYKNLSNLEGHRDEQSKDEALGVTINSVILLVLLRNGGYFGPKETPYGAVLSAQEKQMAAVIVHLQEGIRYNLHQIMEVEKTNISCLSMPQNKEVGTAIFPTLLLLNHSCETNTLRLNVNGNQVLLVAKRSIKAGEEVTDNYGIHHLSFPLEERQEKLHKGFKFCCWCEGCQKDFPRMKSLRTQLPEDVEDRFDKLREEIMELFRKNKLAECKQMSLDMVKILEKAVIPHPHRNYEMASLGLLSCLWALHGNKGEDEKKRK